MTDPGVVEWLQRAEPAIKDLQEACDLVTGDPIIAPDTPSEEATWDEIMAIGDLLEAGAVRFERWLFANPAPSGAEELAQHLKGISDAILEARAKQRNLAGESEDDEATLQRIRALRDELSLEVRRQVAEANRIVTELVSE